MSAGAQARVQRVLTPGGELTWTVLGPDHRPIEPAEDYLEYLRVLGRSPNTVKSYARAMALWWEFLALYDLAWEKITLEDFGGFLCWLRSGETPRLASIERRPARFAESTIAVRIQAVSAFYRYQHFNGVQAASRLYERYMGHRRPYRPMLEHIARRRAAERSVVALRRPRRAVAPTLRPEEIQAILDACARFEPERREWVGSLRDRLLFAVLWETGLRLGEALGLQHCDWYTGRGDTPYIEVVARDDAPHGVRVKNGAGRRIYISDELDRLYGEYLWQLCDAGAETAVPDLDRWWLFVNLYREPRFAPLRPETVAAKVRRLRRTLAGRVPERFTPHWFRHTHATALLSSGIPEHVVSRRLGHRDIQTTQNLYGWVSEDDEQRTLAQWRSLTERWRGLRDARC